MYTFKNVEVSYQESNFSTQRVKFWKRNEHHQRTMPKPSVIVHALRVTYKTSTYLMPSRATEEAPSQFGLCHKKPGSYKL